MKFKKEDLLELEDGESPKGFELVEEGEWEVDCKYQHRFIVFKYQDKYYMLTSSRSGSPFTDYEYESQWWDAEEECPEVQEVSVMVTEWRTVPKP